MLRVRKLLISTSVKRNRRGFSGFNSGNIGPVQSIGLEMFMKKIESSSPADYVNENNSGHGAPKVIFNQNIEHIPVNFVANLFKAVIRKNELPPGLDFDPTPLSHETIDKLMKKTKEYEERVLFFDENLFDSPIKAKEMYKKQQLNFAQDILTELKTVVGVSANHNLLPNPDVQNESAIYRYGRWYQMKGASDLTFVSMPHGTLPMFTFSSFNNERLEDREPSGDRIINDLGVNRKNIPGGLKFSLGIQNMENALFSLIVDGKQKPLPHSRRASQIVQYLMNSMVAQAVQNQSDRPMSSFGIFTDGHVWSLVGAQLNTLNFDDEEDAPRNAIWYKPMPLYYGGQDFLKETFNVDLLKNLRNMIQICSSVYGEEIRIPTTRVTLETLKVAANTTSKWDTAEYIINTDRKTPFNEGMGMGAAHSAPFGHEAADHQFGHEDGFTEEAEHGQSTTVDAEVEEKEDLGEVAPDEDLHRRFTDADFEGLDEMSDLGDMEDLEGLHEDEIPLDEDLMDEEEIDEEELQRVLDRLKQEQLAKEKEKEKEAEKTSKKKTKGKKAKAVVVEEPVAEVPEPEPELEQDLEEEKEAIPEEFEERASGKRSKAKPKQRGRPKKSKV